MTDQKFAIPKKYKALFFQMLVFTTKKNCRSVFSGSSWNIFADRFIFPKIYFTCEDGIVIIFFLLQKSAALYN